MTRCMQCGMVNFHMPSVTHSVAQPTAKKYIYIMMFWLSPHLGIFTTTMVLLLLPPKLVTFLQSGVQSWW